MVVQEPPREEVEAAGGDDDDDSFVVRLAGSEGEAEGDEGVHTVGLELLRPGHAWKGNRWAGRWAPKPKNRKTEEKEAAFEALKVEWPVGRLVEVRA